MSSPFQQSFSARSPFGNKGVVTLSEKDIKDAKSASSQPAAEISFEGQGGIDYENDPRFAENPEGQGGKDYEADDSVAKMVSPLNDKYGKGSQGDHRMTTEAWAREEAKHTKNKETRAEAKLNREDLKKKLKA